MLATVLGRGFGGVMRGSNLPVEHESGLARVIWQQAELSQGSQIARTLEERLQ